MITPFCKDILTVQELSLCLKQQLNDAFPFVAVKGEISNVYAMSTVTYFTLKDAFSQIPVIVFASELKRSAFKIEEGEAVIIFGRIDVYPKTGRYQLVARKMQAIGLGNLQVQLEALKAKLAQEGLFDAETKKKLPLCPQHIAIVTASEGAALQDFLKILKRKNWRGHVTVCPSLVQGNKAVSSLLHALRCAEKLPSVDVVVVARGGGSLEDLWCFNDEKWVRALHACSKPTISAVGHEIDYTLTDFVADVRLETPTAAAEFIVQRYEAAQQALVKYRQTCLWAYQARLNVLKSRLSSLEKVLVSRDPEWLLNQYHERLMQFVVRLRKGIAYQCTLSSFRFNTLKERFKRFSLLKNTQVFREVLIQDAQRALNSLKMQLGLKRMHLNQLSQRLANVRLEKQLQRGFIIPLDDFGNPVFCRRLELNQYQNIWHNSGKYRVLVCEKL